MHIFIKKCALWFFTAQKGHGISNEWLSTSEKLFFKDNN
jgi:hypothetical protein